MNRQVAAAILAQNRVISDAVAKSVINESTIQPLASEIRSSLVAAAGLTLLALNEGRGHIPPKNIDI